jgi:hypothetical protein
MERERQTHLREHENVRGDHRFLELSLFTAPPMTAQLSGLEVEYAVALLYSSEASRREAPLAFDIGQGTQDLGFRAEVPGLLDVRPAGAVRLAVRDFDGQPTTARLTLSDARGHAFPPEAHRFAPDFFSQKHIYRADGSTVLLPPGQFTMAASRGPEHRTVRRSLTIPAEQEASRSRAAVGLRSAISRSSAPSPWKCASPATPSAPRAAAAHWATPPSHDLTDFLPPTDRAIRATHRPPSPCRRARRPR